MQSGAGNITNLSASFTASRVGGVQSVPAAEGEITLQDVADTLNPLNHIPFISTLYHEFTDSKPSTGSQLAGGALYGGPIGFVASLANVIYEGITGKGIDETIVAALKGDDAEAATQLASNTSDPTQEILPPETPQSTAAAQPARYTLASAADPAATVDTRVLDLYGGSQSASRAYQRAQFRPYLQDVSQSMVL